MKVLTSTLLLLLSTFNLCAQKHKKEDEQIYLFDEAGNNITNIDNAATYQLVIKKDDTTFIVRNYKNYGPMIWQQSFKDSALTIPNGRFAWYNKNGDIDSSGIALNGQKTGVWNYFDGADDEKIVDRKFFKNGEPINASEYYTNANYAGIGAIKAVYPKGENGWSNYIYGNSFAKIIALIPQYKNVKSQKAPVLLSFTVNESGKIVDTYIMHSCGFPFDKESLRIINNAKKWVPAQEYGHKVKYKIQQTIIFDGSL